MCRTTQNVDNFTFWAQMQVPANSQPQSVRLTVCSQCGTCYQPRTDSKSLAVITLDGYREGETTFQVELPSNPNLCYETRHTLKQDLQTLRAYLAEITDNIQSVHHNSQYDEDYKIKEWYQFPILHIRTIMVAAWHLNRQWRKMWDNVNHPECPLDKQCYLRQGHEGECRHRFEKP